MNTLKMGEQGKNDGKIGHTLLSIAHNFKYTNQNEINICIYNVLVGCAVQNVHAKRDFIHILPAFVEHAFINFDNICTNLMRDYMKTVKKINIVQNVLLIDPLLYNNDSEKVNLPKFLTNIMQDIIDYNLHLNIINDNNIYKYENTRNDIIIKNELIFYPFTFETSHALINSIIHIQPILNTYCNNSLIIYFDMSGRDYNICLDMLMFDNHKIYSIASDCSLNILNAYTIPIININDSKECEWFHDFSKIDIIPDNLLEHVHYTMHYLYYDILVQALKQIIMWCDRKHVYHITSGDYILLNSVYLKSYGNTYEIDTYFIPVMKYRCGGHILLPVIIWYLNKFKRIHNYSRAIKVMQQSTGVDISLIDFIKYDCEFYSKF